MKQNTIIVEDPDLEQTQHHAHNIESRNNKHFNNLVLRFDIYLIWSLVKHDSNSMIQY